MSGIQISGYVGLAVGEWGLSTNEHKGTFQGDEKVLNCRVVTIE